MLCDVTATYIMNHVSIFNAPFKLQGHQGWIQDAHFGESKKWIVTCAKVCTNM